MPIPADARAVADESGPREYWESIEERLTRATAPRYHVTGLRGYGVMAGVFRERAAARPHPPC